MKVTLKDGGQTTTYHAIPILQKEQLEALLKGDSTISIITLNNPDNLHIVLKQWKTMAQHKNLTFWFINPFSHSDKKWIIKPYVHNTICDPESLELGLKTMAEGVEFITLEEFLKKI